MASMLAYARKHGIAVAPVYDMQALCQNLYLDVTDLPSISENLVTPFLASKLHAEQFLIPQESLTLLTDSIRAHTEPELAKLRPHFESCIELPLEGFWKASERFYTIPKSLHEAVQGLLPFNSEDDDLEDISVILTRSRSEIPNMISEVVYMDESASELLQSIEDEFSTPHIASNIFELRPKQCAHSHGNREMYIDLPLLPFYVDNDIHCSAARPDLTTCMVSDTAGMDLEEDLHLTLERCDSSSSYLSELYSTLELPDLPAQLKPTLHIEFDAPLSPRRNVQGLLSPSLNGIPMDANLVENVQVSALNTSPVIHKLEALLGVGEDTKDHDPFANEELFIYDTTLRIKEPKMSKVARIPELHEYPTSVLDLLRGQNSLRAMFAVDAVPARHLDLSLRWNPFVRALESVDYIETLVGERFVEDYVAAPISTELAEHVFTETTRSSLRSDDSILQLSHSGSKTDTLSFDTDSANLTMTRIEGAYTCASKDHTRSRAGMLQDIRQQVSDTQHTKSQSLQGPVHTRCLDQSSENLPAPYITDLCLPRTDMSSTFTLEASDNLTNERSELPRRSSQTKGSLRLQRQDEFVNKSPDTSALQQPAPSSAKDTALVTASRKRPRLHADLEIARSNHIPHSLEDHINMHMKFRGLEPIMTTQRPLERSISVDSTPSIAQVDDRIIAPQPTHDDTHQAYCIISTCLLQLSAVSRPFCRQLPTVTFIERDLPQLTEADLVISTSTGIILFRIEHVLCASFHQPLASQTRITNLLNKYERLIILVMSRGSLTEQQVLEYSTFQGWLTKISTLFQMIVCPSEEATVQYLVYLAHTFGDSQVEVLQEEELTSEKFLRQCPLVNAIVAQKILNRISLFGFLRVSLVQKVQVLHEAGVSDYISQSIAQFFTSDWHSETLDGAQAVASGASLRGQDHGQDKPSV